MKRIILEGAKAMMRMDSTASLDNALRRMAQGAYIYSKSQGIPTPVANCLYDLVDSCTPLLKDGDQPIPLPSHPWNNSHEAVEHKLMRFEIHRAYAAMMGASPEVLKTCDALLDELRGMLTLEESAGTRHAGIPS